MLFRNTWEGNIKVHYNPEVFSIQVPDCLIGR